MKPSRPVVVAGMHRSGLSLATALLGGLGVDLGPDSPTADAESREGPSLGGGFSALNRRLVREACDAQKPGYPDWGWTEDGSFETSGLAARRDEGRRLLERLGPRRGPWGFADPLGVLVLDFWDGLLDDARYVLVYRNPWEVADSMQRLGADAFLRRPDYAAKIWSFYNRRVLEFYRRHAHRCALVSAEALVERPTEVASSVTRKLGIELETTSTPSEVFDGRRLTRVPPGDPWPRLFAATYPGTLDVLGSLEAAADVPSGVDWSGRDGAGGPLAPHRRESSPGGPEPRVAVVIPCRDLGHLLGEAVASVERSIAEPYELIVVDDGSTDPDTLEIMKRLREAGYRIERQEPSGVCAARNR
ncbi:MAG: glycosyltransferase, partial [Acidobacteriota bacterium]